MPPEDWEGPDGDWVGLTKGAGRSKMAETMRGVFGKRASRSSSVMARLSKMGVLSSRNGSGT